MGIDPFSIAAELAAGKTAASVWGRIAPVLQRRECRRQLARNVWTELVKRSDERLQGRQGCLDPDALWEWTTEATVHAALLSADPARIRQHGTSLRTAWRSSSYDATNPLSDEDGELAAELVFYLLVIDVLAGDELLSTYAARILDAIEGVHDDLALVCVTLAESHVDMRDVARRRLAILSEEALTVADRGLVEPGGEVTFIDRSDAERELQAAIEDLTDGSVLVVTGQPDVGKSHLTMSVARRLRHKRDVFAFDLRRHHNSVADFGTELGDTLRDAFMAAAGDDSTLVVIDGAETVQTLGPDLFLELVGQALNSGCRVVVVSRSDAAGDIAHALAGRGIATSSHEVEGFTDDDLASVVEVVPSARELVSLPAGAWLARRPGLLQGWLVLKPTTPIQNEGHLVELLRNQRIAHAGPGREARLAAVTALARAELGDDSATIDASATDQLRTNGVLANRRNSWETRHAFADDLWRDAALAGLIADDPAVLLGLSGIRSALHASVMACQLRLNTDLTAIDALVHAFDRVSEHAGQARWGEVPFEALTSLGGTSGDWTQILERLAATGTLHRFLSTARRTPTSMLSNAPLAMAGLIDVVLDRYPDVAETQGLVRAWLEAAAIRAPDEASTTRGRVCEHLLAHPPNTMHDDNQLKAWLNDIGMCAVDLTSGGIDVLRRTAAEHPERLNDLFLSLRTGYALAASQPELLVDLCELYYVPSEGWSMEALRAPHRGLGGDRFGAFHTPIARLLQVKPLEALALASRILDAACTPHPDTMTWGYEEAHEPEHIEIDLPGRGPTKLVGEGFEWSWYRGGVASPASAVSILLAIERFADQLMLTGGTVDWVTGLLLQSVQSTPIVGLCVGLSIRHLDLEAPSDSFLLWAGQKVVWELEITRVIEEQVGFGLVRTNEVANEDRRQFPMGHVTPHMAAAAVLRGHADVVSRIEATSLALEASGHDDPVVRSWACGFRPSLMQIVSEGDQRSVIIVPPDDVVDSMAAIQAEIEAASEHDNVAMRYVYRDDLSPTLDHLADDVLLCRSERAAGSAWREARINTAAAAIRGSLAGDADLSADDLCWATEQVLGYLTSEEKENDHSATWRPVQAVASALPTLHSALTAEPTRIQLDNVCARVDAVSLRLAQVGGAEILWTLLADHAEKWRSVCAAGDHAHCPNRLIKELVAVVLERAVREVPRLGGPTVTSTDESGGSSRYIQADLLLAPLSLSTGKTEVCIHVRLDDVVESALALHAEAFGSLHRAPHSDGNHFARIGRILFALACDGRVDRVATYLRSLAPSYQSQALRGMRQVAGDDPEMRPRLQEIWPNVMSQLNGLLTHDDDWTDAHAELVPSVMVDPYSFSQPGAWNEATAHWIDPRAVEVAMARWAKSAAGCGKCAGALGLFMLSADIEWLRTTGLPMLSELVATVELSRLLDRRAAWLADIPNEPRLAAGLVGNGHLLAIIDRYVQADDYYALIARDRLD